ncbi:cold-shock protein [Empedobacter falsenii]
MKEGTVKFFDETKGFGFITAEDNKKDIFVHNSGLIDSIYENDVVTYDLEQGQRGMNAVNVRIKK